MPKRLAWALLSAFVIAVPAGAQEEPDIRIEGVVPLDDETHFFEQFEVPEGIVEIEVRHENLTSGNVLDWGLDDPNGFRGWGGGNREPAVVGEQAASRSYVPGPIPSGTWEVVIGKAQIVETPGRYEIEIFLRTEATLAPQVRMPYEDPGVLDDEARWYAGDLHVHSLESGDARASLRESLDYARSVGLDFVMFSEHNTNSGLTYYGTIQPNYPDVLIVPGVEWTTYSGHANAIGATEWVDHKTGVRGVTVEGAIDAYQQQGAFFYPTHPDQLSSEFCLGCGWEYDVDPTTLDGVEVWTGAIWDGLDFWEEAISGGSRAVAIGGSDDHDAGQGDMTFGRPIGTPTVMVYAENLSVDGIIAGIRAGRTVVRVKQQGFDDPMIETELSGERVGDTVFADMATLSATVTGGDGSSLLVIKNGATIETVPITGDPFTYDVEVVAPEDGEDRYRHQVVSDSRVLTIGSYVWLRAEEPPPADGGCNCRIANSRDADTLFLLALAATIGLCLRRRAI